VHYKVVHPHHPLVKYFYLQPFFQRPIVYQIDKVRYLDGVQDSSVAD
jgi:hypothetical protein